MKMLVAALALAGVTVMAQEREQEPPKPKPRQMDERVWREGRMVCIGCTLAKEHGVDAQCTLHTRHALGFQDQDGRIWTLVDNLRGHGVITDRELRDEPLRVYGWFYDKHQYLECWRYRLPDGDEWEDWDFCKTCGWEPGDHQDKDLCPNCDDGE